jgi:hypothetical protein
MAISTYMPRPTHTSPDTHRRFASALWFNHNPSEERFRKVRTESLHVHLFGGRSSRLGPDGL